MLRITWVVKPVLQWFWTGWGVVWFRSYQDKSIRGLQIVSWAVEAKRRVCMASSDRFLMKLFVCALIVWAAVLLSVPQRLYQSPGPHTPWGCVAAINAASQTERFVVSSISTYIGVGSNKHHINRVTQYGINNPGYPRCAMAMCCLRNWDESLYHNSAESVPYDMHIHHVITYILDKNNIPI